MKRYKKRDMLQSISMLKKANDAVVKTLHKAQRPDLEEALAQCQETAILLGTYLETQGEEGISLVHMLEDYCENIYQMSQSLQDESACRKISKKIQKQLVQVENGIKFQLPPDRREVVFLPYKASMWDSLESVYLAAKEDENCDAYCIPIPYYDRRPDGSLGMMHYEGNEYPRNIEITDYRTYDLEERHPDAIYIHNPYDGWNHVTCVPEQYFASTLRNYTDELVYIPYFVLDEIEPDDQARIEGMKHFCFTPGVIYAHKVIVQSEKMRQIYINEYIKAAKENGLSGEHTDRKYLEQKILGLGSPKFDKVLNTKKEDLDIPEEWLKIIEKPDGSWKKIVFYNTSISALLQYDDKMLKKIRDVFRVFEENQDDVALLWRPHPLIKTTIESMRPQLWEEYNKIVEQYRKEGWGIYDDSSDMDRAVILSDAYYGDSSSVISLCRKVGKPIMIQCPSIVCRYQENIDYLWSYNFELDGENIWFVSYWHNRLYRYSLEKEEIDFVRTLPIANTSEGLYNNVIKVDRNIVLIPSSAAEICIYNLDEDAFTTIPLRKDYIGPDKFGACAVYGNYVYIFPLRYPAICRLNLSDGTVQYQMDWYNKYEFDNSREMFRLSYFVRDNMIYLLANETNCIFRYDMAKNVSKLISVGKEGEKYKTIDSVGLREIYLSDQNGNIYIYKEHTNEVIKFENPYILNANQETYYVSSSVCDNQIFFFPNFEGKCIAVDTTRNEVKEWSVGNSTIMKKGKRDEKGFVCMFSQMKQRENTIDGFNTAERYFFQIDVKSNDVRTFTITDRLFPREREELFQQYVSSEEKFQIETSTSYFNLQMLLEMIKKELNMNQSSKEIQNDPIGKKVYERII